MIEFNAKKGIFTYTVNGKILARSISKEKLEQKVANKFGNLNVTNNEVKVEIKKSVFSVAERFNFVAEFTRLVARNIIPSLVVTGSGGSGKTTSVTNTLTSLGMLEDEDFIFISGYSTARSLYNTLYNNNGRVIVFDDTDSVFKCPIGANILKAALDSKEKRVISWGAESKDDSVPSRFEFYGKIIFISNLSIDKFPQAILSRSMLADITLTMEEKIERIVQVFKEETEYDDADKKEVVSFIKKYSNAAKDLNIRSAFSILKLKVAIGDSWERIALYNFMLN